LNSIVGKQLPTGTVIFFSIKLHQIIKVKFLYSGFANKVGFSTSLKNSSKRCCKMEQNALFLLLKSDAYDLAAMLSSAKINNSFFYYIG
jgi:hypothetical protein